MTTKQLEILKTWYKALDADYGEHTDSESPCEICNEAYQLGLIEDRVAEEPEQEFIRNHGISESEAMGIRMASK